MARGKKKVVKEVNAFGHSPKRRRVATKAMAAIKRGAISHRMKPPTVSLQSITKAIEILVSIPTEYVSCRYCGRKMLKPETSTFYHCGLPDCPGTGEPEFDAQGNRIK